MQLHQYNRVVAQREMQRPCSGCALYRFSLVSGPHSYLKEKNGQGKGWGGVGGAGECGLYNIFPDTWNRKLSQLLKGECHR